MKFEKQLNFVGMVVGHMIKKKKISKIEQNDISPDVAMDLQFSAAKCVQTSKNITGCFVRLKKKEFVF